MTTEPTPLLENGLGTLHLDGDGVATLTLRMAGRANRIDPTFLQGFHEALDALEAAGGLRGVIVTSAHRDFCVGADLSWLAGAADAAALLRAVRALHGVLRRLETLGAPVVAALNGTALGGGYELALACHHRIALDRRSLRIGLPEVLLGLLPGGGGTQRLPRLVGVQAALDAILQGRRYRPADALSAGLVDELASDDADLLARARAWIADHAGARQPWDDGRPPPGPALDSEMGRGMFTVASAMLFRKTAGAHAAPIAALRAVHEGIRLAFDRALEVEARRFVQLATGPQAHDMIRTLWFHRNAVERQEALPTAPASGVRRLAVLGAGMMGAGLAYVAARAGFEVVLKDVGEEPLHRGMAHVRAQVERLRHLDASERSAILARVHPTLELEDLRGVDLVIEAVFEDVDLKHRVIRETEPFLAEDAIFASNTSAIPIGVLAEASRAPERFIGLHFFSPVERMELLEVVRGEATSERTLGRCLALARELRKLPIVVRDRYAFYTTRVFGAYIVEGAQLVAEGQDPVLVEWAARRAGMVVPPLKAFDEVTLTLGVKAASQRRRFVEDEDRPDLLAGELLQRMVAAGRTGKAAGAGFYVYEGRERWIWPGLRALAAEVRGDRPPAAPLEVPELADRLLYAQVAQVGACLDEGVIERLRDAEVGAIFGIGFAPQTGGPLSWVDRRGADRVVADLERLEREHGPRFRPAAAFRRLAAEGGRFFPSPERGS